MRKNSVKNTRVNGEVMRVLADIIRGDIKDPRIGMLTSVVNVEVAPDLKTCKAWISVFGDDEAVQATLEGLNSAKSYIRRELARRINLRNTPDITFVIDQSIAYCVKMSRVIQYVNEAIASKVEDEEAQNV